MIVVLVAAIAAALWITFSMGGGLKIADYARKAGFSGDDLLVAVAIALAESGGDTYAVGDKDLVPEKGPSLGLWQINMGTKEHAAEFKGQDMFDPQVNANAAYKLYARRNFTFGDWSTYTQKNPRTGQPYYMAHLEAANSEVNA